MRHLPLAMLLSASAFAAEPVFTLADLEALAKQQAWAELTEHLGDVPPAQRNERWAALADQSAVGALSMLKGADEKEWAFADSVVRRYPQLLKSMTFMAARREAAMRGLEVCLRRSLLPSTCADRAVSSIEVDPGDFELAWTVASAIARFDSSSAVRVYRLALRTHATARECTDAKLSRAVTDVLYLDPDDRRVADARTIASELCWDGLKEPLLDAFIAGGKSAFRRNTCAFLLEKKDALSPLSRRQCESLK